MTPQDAAFAALKATQHFGALTGRRSLAFLTALPEGSALVTADSLRSAGFEPDFNVCVGCHHDGGDHDLNNRCLICGDRFASMSKAEQWAWAMHLLRARP